MSSWAIPNRALQGVSVALFVEFLVSCAPATTPQAPLTTANQPMASSASSVSSPTSAAPANNQTATPTAKKSATVILALKKHGQNECVINTSLTAISNVQGEVLIQNLQPGEYIVFQSPSGTVNPALNGKVVTWSPSANGYSFSFGAVIVTKGNMVITPDGALGIAGGYMEGQVLAGGDGVLAMTTTSKGALTTVQVVEPSKEAKIVINSDGTVVDAPGSSQK